MMYPEFIWCAFGSVLVVNISKIETILGGNKSVSFLIQTHLILYTKYILKKDFQGKKHLNRKRYIKALKNQ